MRNLLALVPAAFILSLAAALPSQAPLAHAAGEVVIVVRSHAPVFRHVGPRTRRYVAPAERAAPLVTRRAPALRHLKGR